MRCETLPEFLSAALNSTCPELLFELYQRKMQSEGFDVILYFRGDDRDQIELPFSALRKGTAKLYFTDRLWEDDPIIAAARSSIQPFTWTRETLRETLSHAGRRVLEVAEAMGVRSGLVIPFHRPNKGWDLMNLGSRTLMSLDNNRIGQLGVQTYAVVQRYAALMSDAGGPAFAPQCRSVSFGIPQVRPCRCSRNQACGHPQHGLGQGAISDDECRAIALVDIGARRHKAGLLELNKRVPDIVGHETLQGFIDRGLIEEDCDDSRFAYVFRPSPVGQSHVVSCPSIGRWRREVWSSYVERDERPVD